MVGLADVTEFDCPLTQYDLADALGLSSIHVNRVLRELREVKLLTFQDHIVTIHDRAGLKELARPGSGSTPRIHPRTSGSSAPLSGIRRFVRVLKGLPDEGGPVNQHRSQELDSQRRPRASISLNR